MERINFSDESVANESASYIIQRVQKLDQDKSKHIVIALSGGNSPRALYHALNNTIPEDIKTRLIFIQVDERIVDPSHVDSNQKLVRDTLKDLLNNGAKFYPMPIDINALNQKECQSYEDLIKELIDKEVLAIALLGAGEDGHTASIFPDHLSDLPKDDRLVFLTPREKNGYYRMSLSMNCLHKFQKVIMYVPGASKKEIVSQITDKENITLYPASDILFSHKDAVLITSS